jgi:hypothetical protein
LENTRQIRGFPFDDNSFIVMYHGILSETRGLQQTIEAVKALNVKYPDIVFFILGDGKARGELEALIDRLNLQKNVFIHSPVPYDDVPKYIASCDVGIVPLPDILWWRISSPLKLVEYLIMEKPVIMTDIEAHRRVVGDLPCGIIIKSHDPCEIAKGIEKAYHLKKEFKKMGKLARELIVNKHTWKKQAESLCDFLRTL